MNNKKKVLFVTMALSIGGVQKSLVSALKQIDYDLYDVTVYARKNRVGLCSEIPSEVKIIVNSDNSHVYRNPYALLLQGILFVCNVLRTNSASKRFKELLNRFVRNQKNKYEQKKYFSDEKYDIAISYIQGATTGFVADCVKADKKIVFYHSSEDEEPSVQKEAFKHFDSIVAVNEGVKEVLCRLYPEESEKITVIRNYVDYNKVISSSLLEDPRKGDKRLWLCSCGRISIEKGFDIAVGAANILKINGIDFIWWFIGDGPDRDAIENKINEYSLQTNVVITGMKDNPFPLMSACDIYVQPSYKEAHPLTLIEAQILNKPIITTKTVGGMALVRDGIDGLHSDMTAESIADKIMKLYNDRELSRIFTENLRKIDYAEEAANYKKSWKALLEQ